MSGQIVLRVTMELLSDTIFGSGYSIPGGEDISVCRDDAGWPYLKGSTFKGLLRESAENHLCWTGGETRGGVANSRCIRYRLHTESPVLATDLSRSSEYNYETKGYIPGSAMRGMVISALSANAPDWFAAHRVELLSERTRFLDAVPIVGEGAPLPSIKGFYESKEETNRIESVVPNGSFTPGFKRAKLGSFCAIEEDTLRYWSASTGGATRIGRGKHDMFQTRQLDAGQDFEGCIQLDQPELSEQVSACLSGTVWLGADRWGGFGRCSVTLCEDAGAPRWIEAYGLAPQETPGEALYLLAVSPLAMLDEQGDPCGLNIKALGALLGVKLREIEHCATSIVEQGGYNRTWGSRIGATQFYDRGSVFRLRFEQPPTLERIRAVEESGLGIRRAEGFGQVLFLSPARFEKISRKAAPEKTTIKPDAAGAALRRAKYSWVIDNANRVGGGVSNSQIGTIQSLCEKALSKDGDASELWAFFDKNLNERGAKHGARFRGVHELVKQVLDEPLSQTLGMHCEGSAEEKLRLLILLFDYSRKGEREK